MELLKTIILLCQISTGNGDIQWTEGRQLQCKQYYIKCIKKQALLGYTLVKLD